MRAIVVAVSLSISLGMGLRAEACGGESPLGDLDAALVAAASSVDYEGSFLSHVPEEGLVHERIVAFLADFGARVRDYEAVRRGLVALAAPASGSTVQVAIARGDAGNGTYTQAELLALRTELQRQIQSTSLRFDDVLRALAAGTAAPEGLSCAEGRCTAGGLTTWCTAAGCTARYDTDLWTMAWMREGGQIRITDNVMAQALNYTHVIGEPPLARIEGGHVP